MSHRDTSVAIKQALNRSMQNLVAQSQPVCFNEDYSTLNVTQGHKRSYQTSSKSINAKSRGTILARMFQGGLNYSQHCNQIKVSISTDLFTNLYMLHVKFLYIFTILRR